MNKYCVLFDLDGVILDTESQYDIFWRNVGNHYHLGIDHFEKKIKGTTLPNILKQYFAHLPLEEQEKIVTTIRQFEAEMDFVAIPGAIDFIVALKNAGIKIGLVTSSEGKKLKIVFEKMHFEGLFDTVVSADRITQGKPHPMCYLLAAADLGMQPADCVVFEDALAGIQAGNDAGMKVVGLSTTYPVSAISDKVLMVIPDFRHFGLEELRKI